MDVTEIETPVRNELHTEIVSVPTPSQACDDSDRQLFSSTLVDASNDTGELSLQGLFDAAHMQLEDPVCICKQIEPFIETALQNEPNSRVLREAAAFIKSGTMATQHSGWQCTVAQLHSIIHLLNNNEMLIQTGPEIATNNTLDADDRDFLAQLEDCAI